MNQDLGVRSRLGHPILIRLQEQRCGKECAHTRREGCGDFDMFRLCIRSGRDYAVLGGKNPENGSA